MGGQSGSQEDKKTPALWQEPGSEPLKSGLRNCSNALQGGARQLQAVREEKKCCEGSMPVWLDNALSTENITKGSAAVGECFLALYRALDGMHAERERQREERQRRLLGVDARRLAACGLERRRQVVREPPVRAYIPVKLSEVVVEVRRRHPRQA